MTKRLLALLASAALLGACNDATGVPDLNNVSAETIAGGLTTATAQLLVTGLMNQYRNSAIGNFVVFPETMARDALRIDKAETRYLTELIGTVQPDNGAFTGSGVFTRPPAPLTSPSRQLRFRWRVAARPPACHRWDPTR